ncbi:N-acetylneuraminate lyase [Streptococcus pyogenes]|uniref:dihydrodipicolinate synthase family protein n=1 Tax=Streptococcus pyogenes TaxID=1314 RepID=UPI00109D7E71|nr:dihydrodipicolinate synthase family protein [Streptococcus pyogenes]VHA12857.1 N-acetylneuraminate lyase [Streptococcus pyogenes]
MTDLTKYQGIIPAFYACYDDQGNISPERVRALTQYYIDKGVQGLYINGSSGECIYQSVFDRQLVLENVMAVAKGKLTIINHVACNNTKDSIELAAHSERLGVDAIAAIPPIYFRLPEYAVADYWNAISSAAPHTDFIIYNIPQLAGVALTPSLYKTMLANKRVIGVKNSSMPELFLRLNQLIADKDLEKAKALQYTINEIIGVLVSAHGNMYGVIKEVLRINEGLDIGSVRSPLAELVEEDRVICQRAAALINQAKETF